MRISPYSFTKPLHQCVCVWPCAADQLGVGRGEWWYLVVSTM